MRALKKYQLKLAKKEIKSKKYFKNNGNMTKREARYILELNLNVLKQRENYEKNTSDN